MKNSSIIGFLQFYNAKKHFEPSNFMQSMSNSIWTLKCTTNHLVNVVKIYRKFQGLTYVLKLARQFPDNLLHIKFLQSDSFTVAFLKRHNDMFEYVKTKKTAGSSLVQTLTRSCSELVLEFIPLAEGETSGDRPSDIRARNPGGVQRVCEKFIS